ncbi:MAG: TolC family protein, partial [Sphingobacteriales bacterium]
LKPDAVVALTDEGYVPNLAKIDNLNLANLMESALKNRPDVKYAKLTEEYSNQKYKYERSLRTPDVTLQASYDRGGNIMNNFVGFGFSVDLPFFNQNKGNIRSAKIEIEQSRLLAEQKSNSAQAEIIQAYSNLTGVKKVYEDIEQDYEKDLDLLVNSYLKNFMERNTSLLEYLDYVDAYLENKTILLTIQKELNEHLEELKYMSGEELN